MNFANFRRINHRFTEPIEKKDASSGDFLKSTCIFKGGENRICFIKDVEITDGEADTIYSALNNKTEKDSGIESLSAFGSDGGKCNDWEQKSCLQIEKGYSDSNIHPLSQL